MSRHNNPPLSREPRSSQILVFAVPVPDSHTPYEWITPPPQTPDRNFYALAALPSTFKVPVYDTLFRKLHINLLIYGQHCEGSVRTPTLDVHRDILRAVGLSLRRVIAICTEFSRVGLSVAEAKDACFQSLETYPDRTSNKNMAEAIAGLSLAANIMQVINFGANFVSLSWKIWNAGQDGLSTADSLKQLAKDLKHVVQRLNHDIAQQPSRSPHTDSALTTLGRDCIKVSERLLEILEKSGVHSVNNKRGAFATAFRLLWVKDDIENSAKL